MLVRISLNFRLGGAHDAPPPRGDPSWCWVLFFGLLLAPICNASTPASSSATAPLCELKDYRASPTPCDASSGTRTIVYQLPPGHTCRVGSGEESITTREECVCLAEDFEPVFSQQCGPLGTAEYTVGTPEPSCQGHGILSEVCPNHADAAQQTPCGETLCACSADDIGTAFTPCERGPGSTRRIVSFWKKKCEPGPLTLPPPSPALDCDARCKVGHFLAPSGGAEGLACQACPAGFTASPVEVYGPPWVKLPPSMYAHCVGKSCAHWTLEGGYIASTPSVDRTELRLYVGVKQVPAYITFTYRIVNKILSNIGNIVVYVDGFYAMSSNKQAGWQTTSVDLIGRGACLWELKLATQHATHTVCLRQNHVMPFKPSLAIPEAFDEFGEFHVNQILLDSPCDAIRRPHTALLGGRWIAIVKESALSAACTWDQLLIKAKSLKCSAVVIVTERDLDYEWSTTRSQAARLDIPLAHIRAEEVSDDVLQSSVRATFILKEYEQMVSEVQFYYSKYAEFDNVSSVHIRDIEIHGTASAASECRACPPGTSSEEGSELGCQLCEPGHHAPKGGAAVCEKCVDGDSTPDRLDCVSVKCNEDVSDYTVGIGKCRRFLVQSCDNVTDCQCTFQSDTVGIGGCGKLRELLQYYSPVCDPFLNKTHTPHAKQLQCSACPKGTYLDVQLECARCPTGWKSTPPQGYPVQKDASAACEVCPKGVLPVLEYPGDRDWRPRHTGGLCDEDDTCAWVKDCDYASASACYTAAFRSPTDSTSPILLREGLGMAQLADTTQTLTTTNTFLTGAGGATFAFSFSSAGHPITGVQVRFTAYCFSVEAVVFSVDHLQDAKLDRDGGAFEGSWGLVATPPLSGRCRLRWEYVKSSTTPSDVIFELLSVTLTGVEEGGSDSCIDTCPAGMACDVAAFPIPCPPGQFKAAAGDDPCTPCPEGTHTPFAGSTSCLPCPGYLQRSSNGVRCELPPSCNVTLPDGSVWDLDRLGNSSEFDVVPSAALREERSAEQGGAVEVAHHVALCPQEWQSFAKRKQAGRAASGTIARSVASIAPGPAGGLTIVLEGGDPCMLANGTAARLSAEVSVSCGVGGASASPMEQLVSTRDCVTRYAYATAAPCKQCTPDMWELVTTDKCIAGFLQVEYVPRTPCFGVAPAVAEAVGRTACTVRPGGSSGEGGGVSVESEPEEQTNSLVSGVLLATFVPLLCLACVGGLLWKRNKLLEAKYSALTSRRRRAAGGGGGGGAPDTADDGAARAPPVDDDDMFDGL